MKPIRIFISSVQKEFAEERAALRDYLRGDPLFRRFYDVFLFEDVPAIAKLRKPHGSVPWNPLLAEPLYLTRYIERMGTGTGDMIKRCRDVGLDEPEFALTDGFVVTIRRKPELAFEAVGGITGEVQRLLKVLVGEMKRTYIQEALALRHEDYFREAYLIPALTAGMIEMTIPSKPTSSKQKYRVTEKGQDLLKKTEKGESGS